MNTGIIYVDHPYDVTFRIVDTMKEEAEGVHESEMGNATAKCPEGSNLAYIFGAPAKNYGFPLRGKDVYEVAYNVAATE